MVSAMNSFGIHFLFCNIFVSIIIGVILLLKRIFRNYLSGESQYRIWFLLPVILAVPFLSVRPAGFSRLAALFHAAGSVLSPEAKGGVLTAAAPLPAADWMENYGVSVTRASASFWGCLLFVLWAGGMLAMSFSMISSKIRLYRMEKSALPLQSRKARALCLKCMEEMQIRRNIPVCSTAFLKSPVIIGMFRPRIYIPIHLISDFNEQDMRYMLLHELQHYKHKDAFINCLMNGAAIIYWFNPVVWYALREVRIDREIACDTFVLQMLDADDHIGYGNTLLNFAQKVSRSPFSLVTGIGGSTTQIKKRILNIALYRPRTRRFRIKEGILFTSMLLLLLESTTFIPVLASGTRASLPKNAVIYMDDLSEFFGDYEGSFVLYDAGADAWDIYNEDFASRRFSPDSTYKIYSALLALENGSITPDSSYLKWNRQSYPFSEWNRDQTLSTAMANSVNWYFQTLDRDAGMDALKEFYQAIDYGNQDLSGGISEFWMESSLKISAIEQVELLKRLYTNEFSLKAENVQTVKDSLRLSASGESVLSGKTGTGTINGKNVNGWFIGYVESEGNTWFFAINIQGEDHADSKAASEIALGILADKGIFS